MSQILTYTLRILIKKNTSYSYALNDFMNEIVEKAYFETDLP